MYTHRMLEVTVEKLEIADHKQKELTEDISSFFVKTIRTSGEKKHLHIPQDQCNRYIYLHFDLIFEWYF